ncbi:LON peptidase substrate-binding domain-containing protein [Verrucomicrobiales bacterium BCK34]|nr:LON peptidase substrate-binding domain-containing protein [Verrucomicrobiales bacterium BCK34]
MLEEEANLPDTLPVMVLSGATLFPHSYMPLFIFEQRYRDMLQYTLQHERMFCVGNARPGVNCDTHPDPVYPITTAGLVRACVTHHDGTSHLMLSGIQRVEILGWEQVAPFRIATILPRPCFHSDESYSRSLALELIDLGSQMCGEGQPMSKPMQEHLRGIKDPAAIGDVVAHTFVNTPEQRQELLEIDDVSERLGHLVNHLTHRLTNGDA